MPGQPHDDDQGTGDGRGQPPAADLLRVEVHQLDPGAPLPTYARPGDAGADLITTRDVLIGPGEREMVGTGLAIALPRGYAAFVHPRSGLAARVGLSIVNTPGTIDSGYRGEIRLSLINHDLRAAIALKRGDRIAQLVIQRVEQAHFVAVDALPASDRGDGGYGSTGGAHALAGDRSLTDQHITDQHITEAREGSISGAG